MIHYMGAFELMVDNLIQNDKIQDKLNFAEDGDNILSEAGLQSFKSSEFNKSSNDSQDPRESPSLKVGKPRVVMMSHEIDIEDLDDDNRRSDKKQRKNRASFTPL